MAVFSVALLFTLAYPSDRQKGIDADAVHSALAVPTTSAALAEPATSAALPSVFVLYTGGTIGSKKLSDGSLAPVNTDEFKVILAQLPGFSSSSKNGFGSDTVTVNLNDDNPEVAISYTVEALVPAIDSSSMTPEQWLQIAEIALEKMQVHDGIVILHGTDTLAYTSSALAFLLAGTPKPVVVTGSQIPLAFSRNDATLNLMTAIAVAGTSKIPSVLVAFSDRILAGPRAVKVNADALNGFDSPNFPWVGKNNIALTYDFHLIPPKPSAALSLTNATVYEERKRMLFSFHAAFGNFSVAILPLYPGIEASTVRGLLRSTKPAVRGLCLEAFGSGNAPENAELLSALEAAHTDHGVVIVDITQIPAGTVHLGQYAAAGGLAKAGAVAGLDMTTEACYAKLVTLIASGKTQREVEAAFEVDMVGEVTIS